MERNNTSNKDPYLNEETGVLKNKLNCYDYHKLKDLERAFTLFQLVTVENLSTEKCSPELLKKVHKYIFEDIYEWAGEYRKVPLYKIERVLPGLSLEYAKPKDIDSKLKEIFIRINKNKWEGKSLETVINEFAGFLTEIWKVHPFRDGNTRTTLSFGKILGKQIGLDLDLSYIRNELNRKYDKNGKITRISVRDALVLAALDKKDNPEPKYFQSIIRNAIIIGYRTRKKQQNGIRKEPDIINYTNNEHGFEDD